MPFLTRFDRIFSRARKLASTGSSEDALSAFDEAVSIRDSCAQVHIHRALTLSEMGRFDDAMTAAAKAVDLQPENPACHIFQAMVLLDAGQLDDAIGTIDKALELEGVNTLAKAVKVLIVLKKGTGNAATLFKDIQIPPHHGLLVRLAPALEEACLARTLGSQKIGPELKRAKKLSTKKRGLIGNPELPLTTPEASLRKGKRLFFNEKFEASAKHLGAASALASAACGTALFMAGKLDEAREHLRRATEGTRKGTIPATDETLDAMECYGELLWDDGRITDSIAIFLDVKALCGVSGTSADYFTGVLDLLTGRRREGYTKLGIVLTSDPNLPLIRLKKIIEE